MSKCIRGREHEWEAWWFLASPDSRHDRQLRHCGCCDEWEWQASSRRERWVACPSTPPAWGKLMTPEEHAAWLGHWEERWRTDWFWRDQQ
mgnify:CR=1 FL=1